MANKKVARVEYYKVYPPFGEGYAIEILINNTWSLSKFFSLQHGIMDRPEDEKQLVHYGIITELAHLQQLGYDIEIL